MFAQVRNSGYLALRRMSPGLVPQVNNALFILSLQKLCEALTSGAEHARNRLLCLHRQRATVKTYIYIVPVSAQTYQKTSKIDLGRNFESSKTKKKIQRKRRKKANLQGFYFHVISVHKTLS